jgi:hypothetical protein
MSKLKDLLQENKKRIIVAVNYPLIFKTFPRIYEQTDQSRSIGITKLQ